MAKRAQCQLFGTPCLPSPSSEARFDLRFAITVLISIAHFPHSILILDFVIAEFFCFRRAPVSHRCWRALSAKTFYLAALVIISGSKNDVDFCFNFQLIFDCGFESNTLRAGIVTRRPLVLQLQKIDEGREYAEFMHLPRKRFTDFGTFLLLPNTNCFSLTVWVYL